MTQAGARLATALGCALSLPALAGCGASSDGTGDGAGDGAQGLDAPEFAIDPAADPVYTVGALEGDPWETFGQVAEVAFDASGHLYVLDRAAAHVVVVAPSGQHLRTISNKGDGPGELDSPIDMVVLSDGRVAVFDFGKLGIQLFGPDGAFLESVTYDPEQGLPGSGMIGTPGDDLLSVGGIRFSMGGGPPETPEGRPVERFSLDGSRAVEYTAWAPPPPEEGEATELTSEGGGRMRFQMQRMQAFAPPLHVGVLSDGRVLVADSTDYRIKVLGPDGTVADALERPIAPTPVTEEIEERERERQLAALQGRSGGGAVMITVTGDVTRGGGGGGVDQDAIRRMMEDRVGDMLFFPEIPVIARLAVDWSDRIWVERAGLPGEPGPTDILTADGRYLGTIPPDGLRIPNAFGPDGLMAYIGTDELDVQRIRVVRLTADEALEADS